jgi:hypothetical protein
MALPAAASAARPGRVVLTVPGLSAFDVAGSRLAVVDGLRVRLVDLRDGRQRTLTHPGGPTAAFGELNAGAGELAIGNRSVAWAVGAASASQTGGSYVAAPVDGSTERTLFSFRRPIYPGTAIRPVGLLGDGTTIFWATWQGVRRLVDGRQSRLTPDVMRLYGADAGRVLGREKVGLAVVAADGTRTILRDVPQHGEPAPGVNGEPLYALGGNRIAALFDNRSLYTLDVTSGRPVRGFTVPVNMPRSLVYGHGLVAWVDGYAGEGRLHVVDPAAGRAAVVANGLLDNGVALTGAGLFYAHRNRIRLLSLSEVRARVARGKHLPSITSYGRAATG